MKKSQKEESFKDYFLKQIKKKNLNSDKSLLADFVNARTRSDYFSILSRYNRTEILNLCMNTVDIMYTYLDGRGVTDYAVYNLLRGFNVAGKRRCGLV